VVLLRRVASEVYSRVHGWAPATLRIAIWSCSILLLNLVGKLFVIMLLGFVVVEQE
jgi:hypothetical protein